MSYPPPISVTTVQTTAPAVEPLTLSEARFHCRVDNDAEDAFLSILIATAREYVETETERAYCQRSFVSRFSRFPVSGTGIVVPMCPLVSVTSLKYFDASNVEQTLSTGLYTVRTDTTPGSIEEAVGEAWPDTAYRGDAVTLTYVAGYGTAASCPERAKQAIKLLVGHWYENREAAAVGVDVKEVPLAAKALMWQLRTGVMR